MIISNDQSHGLTCFCCKYNKQLKTTVAMATSVALSWLYFASLGDNTRATVIHGFSFYHKLADVWKYIVFYHFLYWEVRLFAHTCKSHMGLVHGVEFFKKDFSLM